MEISNNGLSIKKNVFVILVLTIFIKYSIIISNFLIWKGPIGMTNKKALSVKNSPEIAKFMEDIGLFYENHGIPRIGGRILALLLVTEGMLSADQIATRLKVSRGSVSTNIRLLMNIGLVEKRTVPGDRLDYFRFSDSAWENVFTLRWKAFLHLEKIAQQGLSALPSGDPIRRRLEDLTEWLVFHREQFQKAKTEWDQRHGRHR